MAARQEGGDSLRARLLALAFALLAEVDGPVARRVIVTVEDPDCHTTLRLQGEPADGDDPALTAPERKVLRVASDQPQTVKRLANLAGLSAKYARTLVSSLCRKGKLRRADHGTYCLPG